ncbi:uncharacterized protein LOC134673381 [Cydia fagiglandana]|uniref:uncharacterized protein LOC134673381 n=1 Tax=Cydia fagiglandana TaxID=1458189 RepID=UPI002FEE2EB9
MNEICLIVLLVSIHYVAAMFEYGKHKKGEVLSYKLESIIPQLVPIYRINMTQDRDDIEKHYTYVNVTTLTQALSKPNIIFDSGSNMLTFFIRYPVHTISIEVTGYSMPLKDYNGTVDYVTIAPLELSEEFF